MSENLPATALEMLCRPLARSMSDELARALADLRANEETQRRYDDLASRNTSEQLSDSERAELAGLVRANTLLGVLKAEALLHLRQAAAV
jgi:hypothetical protein